MNDRIALSMIIRGDTDAKNFKRALNSIRPFVDAIYVTVTNKEGTAPEIQKLADAYNVQLSFHAPFWTATTKATRWLKKFFGYDPHMKEGDEVFLFDEARNFNFAQIPKEYYWIVWMDSDDIFRDAKNLKALVQVGLERGVEAFYFEYLYQVDAEEKEGGFQIKHIIIKHLRERLVRNHGVYKWIAPIHETLIEQRPSVKSDNYDCDVVHMATQEDRMKSLTRNLKSLELAVYQTKGEDPRHIYYLAKAYFDLGTEEYDKKAMPLIDRYLLGDENREHMSGWPEERAQACEYKAEILKRRGKIEQAIQSCLDSLAEDPEQPSLYLNLASCYMIKQMWERALFWVKMAKSVPEKKTTLVVNPRDIEGRTLEVIFNCCLNLNRVDEAYKAAVKLMELFPELDSVKNSFNFITNIRNEREITRNVLTLVEALKATGEPHKIQSLLKAVPILAENNPFIEELNKQFNPPKVWEEREIAIYCGPGFTKWGPNIIKDPKDNFVGGSEEAVIMMSEALAQKGWNVTVYADPGEDEGEHNGVTWLPYFKLNRGDEFNILIGWRDIRFFDYPWKARRSYLWCHDIQNPLEFTPERLARITKIFFLSEWHRQNVPELPVEKVMLTSNGIN